MTSNDIVKAIGSALHIDLERCRIASGGQERTYFAECHGEAVVVKWGLDPDLDEKIPYVATQVPELLRRGIPVAVILAHGPVRGGYAWAQQRLPGKPSPVLSSDLLDQLLKVLDLMRDAPAGRHRSDIGYWVNAVICDDLAGYWAATAALGPHAQTLCESLHAWLQDVTAPELQHDFVHADLNLGNVLVEYSLLSGIVDLENLGVGDRSVDVARLAFEWFWQDRRSIDGRAADGLDRLVRYGRSCNGEAGWRFAVAYEIISRLGWRSEHAMAVDPSTLITGSVDFLEAVR